MDYGALLARAWNIIWDNKFLILLGILVVLSGVGNNGAGLFSGLGSGRSRQDFDVPRPPRPRAFPSPVIPGGLSALAVLLVLVLILLIVIPLWVLSTLSRGGLIAGVDAIDAGGTSRFGRALRAGWEKGWRLLGIAVVPAIPTFLLSMLAAGGLVGYLGLARVRTGGAPLLPANVVVGSMVIALTCILALLTLVLNLLQNFANRACMLEDLGVILAYERGVSVLLENLGSALLLFLIQILISVGIGIVMFFFGLLVALCCLLWPVLMIIQGTATAYFSTLWTLAWREWTVDGDEPASNAALVK
ncbi:MAG: hypothetical protein ACLFV5_09375 [Anaerolineales bacterium]